jgi:hypothetical protein
MIGALFIVALLFVAIAGGVGLLALLRRVPRLLLALSIVGAAGVWMSLMAIAVIWLMDQLTVELVALSGLAATASAVVAVNAGCWWLSVRAGRIASGVTAVATTILVIVAFIPFLFGLVFGA